MLIFLFSTESPGHQYCAQLTPARPGNVPPNWCGTVSYQLCSGVLHVAFRLALDRRFLWWGINAAAHICYNCTQQPRPTRALQLHRPTRDAGPNRLDCFQLSWCTFGTIGILNREILSINCNNVPSTNEKAECKRGERGVVNVAGPTYCLCVCTCACAHVCVCVWERERERERERECVCVWVSELVSVCVWVRERERYEERTRKRYRDKESGEREREARVF